MKMPGLPGMNTGEVTEEEAMRAQEAAMKLMAEMMSRDNNAQTSKFTQKELTFATEHTDFYEIIINFMQDNDVAKMKKSMEEKKIPEEDAFKMFSEIASIKSSHLASICLPATPDAAAKPADATTPSIPKPDDNEASALGLFGSFVLGAHSLSKSAFSKKLDLVVDDDITTETRNSLYLRFTALCIASVERLDELTAEEGGARVALLDVQSFLKIDEAEAEKLSTQVAQAMFQETYEAAMQDETLDPKVKENLRQLNENFGSFTSDTTGTPSMDPESTAKMIQSLEELLNEQGVTQEDVAMLRQMCKNIGLDIDELMENADQMEEELGPETMKFIKTLKKLLKDPATPAAAGTSPPEATTPAPPAATPEK
mmetsp:Transcript_13819/g.36840  ORF Transcript_13819/g.36840 Transcript_13819/m.36840 type:complete len:370 (+) Transcript_13819:2-1111(+)